MEKSYWNEKVVVVTGGSSGLGKVLAQGLCAANSLVALWTRDVQRAEIVAGEIRSATGILPVCFGVDVTDELQTRAARQSVLNRFGRIDVLINCVGASSRYNLEQISVAEFRRSMEVNFFSAVNCTQTCLAELCDARGHLINIVSLAGLTAWPYLAPYVASKSALAAYSAQLQLELAGRVQVLTVFPGPIHRSDAGLRYANAAASLPQAAMAPGAGAPVSGLDPNQLARSILVAAQRGKRRLIMPRKAKWLFRIQSICPWLGERLLQRLASKVHD